jgi:D-3-phosphoglycerate dehydrogenase
MSGQVVIAARTFGRVDTKGSEMLKDARLSLAYLPGKEAAGVELATLMQSKDTVAVIAGGEPITGEMIRKSPNLKVIAMHGAGMNHIDQKAAGERGILVQGVPGGNAEAVADLTFGLMLSAARHIAEADAAIRRNEWGAYMGVAVSGKTLGIVGFGAIGQAVARRASGFGMKILAYDVVNNKEAAGKLKAEYVSLETLLSQADFITLHVPFIDSTNNLINDRALRLMKKTAILVNIARGGVVDEDALCVALHDGIIAGAAVDTFRKEPLPEDHCFRSAPNLLLTPHIGGRTMETVAAIGVECARIVLEGLKR